MAGANQNWDGASTVVLCIKYECSRTLQRDIGGFKFGLFTGNGAAVGWNADTAHLVDEGGEGLGS